MRFTWFPQLIIVFYRSSSCKTSVTETHNFIHMRGEETLLLHLHSVTLILSKWGLWKTFNATNNMPFPSILLGEYFLRFGWTDPLTSHVDQGPHLPSLFHPLSAAPSSHPSSIDPGSYLHSDPSVISGAQGLLTDLLSWFIDLYSRPQWTIY